MYKNLKTMAVESLENGSYHVYIKLFPAKQHQFFLNGSQRQKIATTGNKQNKIKEN